MFAIDANHSLTLVALIGAARMSKRCLVHQYARAFVMAAACMLLAMAPGRASDQKAATENDKDKAAFEAVCGACHPVGMVDGIRSEQDWRDTVEQMVSSGAKGTAQQFESVMRYLLRNQTKVNVNTATASEIAPVLGISEEKARAIVTRRKQIGSFKTLQELEKVAGVGTASLEARRDRIVF